MGEKIKLSYAQDSIIRPSPGSCGSKYTTHSRPKKLVDKMCPRQRTLVSALELGQSVVRGSVLYYSLRTLSSVEAILEEDGQWRVYSARRSLFF